MKRRRCRLRARRATEQRGTRSTHAYVPHLAVVRRCFCCSRATRVTEVLVNVERGVHHRGRVAQARGPPPVCRALGGRRGGGALAASAPFAARRIGGCSAPQLRGHERRDAHPLHDGIVSPYIRQPPLLKRVASSIWLRHRAVAAALAPTVSKAAGPHGRCSSAWTLSRNTSVALLGGGGEALAEAGAGSVSGVGKIAQCQVNSPVVIGEQAPGGV